MDSSIIFTHLQIPRPPTKSWRANFISTTTKSQTTYPSSNHESSSSTIKNPQKRREKPSKKLSADDFVPKTIKITSLVGCGLMEDALQLFDGMPKRDTFVWNVILRGLVDVGLYEDAIRYYRTMLFDGVIEDNLTYPFVIKACSCLVLMDVGEVVHARLLKSGLSIDVYVGNSLISMYFKFGCVGYSERLFEEMLIKDLVSWNSMITGYVLVGNGANALMCFRDLQAFEMVPDRFSLVSALGACSMENVLGRGKEIHCHVIKVGLEMDEMIQTALVDMYSKCHELEYAEKCFESLARRSVGAWNAMIGGYVLNDCPVESFYCVKKMQDDDKLAPDVITAVNLIPACALAGALQHGKSAHAFAIRRWFIPHVVLETALVDMYSKCGRLNLAKLLFSQMTSKSAISWNVMIAAYAHHDGYKESLELFQGFLDTGLEPDAVTIASVLPAYAELATLGEGLQIHSYIEKSNLTSNTFISNAIVDMYANCGELSTARKSFDRIAVKDVVSWNTIIMAYALHGFGNDAMKAFNLMLERNIQPNASTFVSLLTACSNSGMVEEAWKYYNLMRSDYGIDPGIEHYGCMVDILGRDGHLESVLLFIEEMRLAPTSRIWGSFLNASKHWKNIEFAEYAAHHILSFDHNNTGCYVILANLYAEFGRWQDVERINLIMKNEGIVRKMGCSVVETGGEVHSFVNQDQSHKGINKVYGALDIIHSKMGETYHVLGSSKFSVKQLDKKRCRSPAFHSVRLALVYGLISTAIGKPVLVRKNIRLCKDCHTAAKKVSQITKREIVIGDLKIFHHFRDGKCTCGDYW